MYETSIKSKIVFVLFFALCFLCGISCETVITPELNETLQEAYCNVTCTNKDINGTCYNCSSSVQLHFKNDTEQLKVDWLCRDDEVLSFNWTSNSKSIYVIEFKSNYDNWTYHDMTMQNITVLKDLDYEEEYEIRIWEVHPDGSVGGPFLSNPVLTLDPDYYPLEVQEFRLVNWEYQDGSSFFANVEWTPAEDRLCYYSIASDDEKIRLVTKDFNGVFKEKIPGFSSGQSYSLRIAPKLMNSIVKNDGTYLEVSTPNCMDLYKSVDMCLPIIPDDVHFSERISKYYKYPSENLTYDVNVTWSDPEYEPDYYIISILILQPFYPPVSQNASGNATSVTFYNLTLTPHYSVKIMMASKAGYIAKLFNTMFTVHPNSYNIPEEPTSIVVIIIFAVAAIAIPVISLISFFCYKRYEKSKMMNNNNNLMEMGSADLKSIHQRQFSIEDDEWKLNSETIEVGKVIGEGVFGVVHKGKRNNENVAIKMLKGNYTSDEVRQFEQEIDIMKIVGFHPNIVSLIGFCLKPEYSCPLLIVEYCEKGNLETHLRTLWTGITTRQYNQREYVNTNMQFANLEYDFPEIADLSKSLLSYAHQIASGMEYLSNNKVVHRDLATRNILLCSNGMVKVADFGLSRDVYLNDTYKKTTSGALPVKWMAIESLTHQLFTSQSDVWSFGVLLWEIATFGEHPYSGTPHEKLLTFLLNGHRLNCPESCHTVLYQIMFKCWKLSPQERPTFTNLVKYLEDLVQSKTQYLFIKRSTFNNEEVLL